MGRLGSKSVDLTEVAVKKLIGDARFHKVWIRVGTTWYTPEEFINLSRATDVNGNTKFEYEKVKISDPIAVISRMQQLVRDRFTELDELQKKVNDFAIKVAEYYKR
jgi:hypothetical protein